MKLIRLLIAGCFLWVWGLSEICNAACCDPADCVIDGCDQGSKCDTSANECGTCVPCEANDPDPDCKGPCKDDTSCIGNNPPPGMHPQICCPLPKGHGASCVTGCPDGQGGFGCACNVDALDPVKCDKCPDKLSGFPFCDGIDRCVPQGQKCCPGARDGGGNLLYGGHCAAPGRKCCGSTDCPVSQSCCSGTGAFGEPSFNCYNPQTSQCCEDASIVSKEACCPGKGEYCADC